MSEDETFRVTASTIRDRFAGQENRLDVLTKRVAKLERDKRLLLAGCVLSVVALAVACWSLWARPGSNLEVTRLALRAPDGTQRAVLEVDARGIAQLVLADPQGQGRLTLACNPKGESFVNLSATGEMPQVGLSAQANGEAAVIVASTGARSGAMLMASDRANPTLSVNAGGSEWVWPNY